MVEVTSNLDAYSQLISDKINGFSFKFYAFRKMSLFVSFLLHIICSLTKNSYGNKQPNYNWHLIIKVKLHLYKNIVLVPTKLTIYQLQQVQNKSQSS